MADVATRMLKGGMWIAGARAVTNGLGFLSTILLARLLVPDDFGLVALATSILAIVNAVTALPVSEALIQHRQTDHGSFPYSMVNWGGTGRLGRASHGRKRQTRRPDLF